jgi:hypothetical protein
MSVFLLFKQSGLLSFMQDCGIGKDDLTPFELQICVDYVNTVVQEEHDRK